MKKSFVFLLAACLGISAGIFTAVAFQVSEISDNGMLPSYEEGEHILVSRLAFTKGKKPKQGDVILMKNQVYAATGESAITIKRVIGVPGDSVMITDGQVYVNNRQLPESYVFTEGISGELEEIEIPEGKFFVLGDNRAASTDSRHEAVGLVDEEELLGKVILKW